MRTRSTVPFGRRVSRRDRANRIEPLTAPRPPRAVSRRGRRRSSGTRPAARSARIRGGSMRQPYPSACLTVADNAAVVRRLAPPKIATKFPYMDARISLSTSSMRQDRQADGSCHISAEIRIGASMSRVCRPASRRIITSPAAYWPAGRAARHCSGPISTDPPREFAVDADIAGSRGTEHAPPPSVRQPRRAEA